MNLQSINKPFTTTLEYITLIELKIIKGLFLLVKLDFNLRLRLIHNNTSLLLVKKKQNRFNLILHSQKHQSL